MTATETSDTEVEVSALDLIRSGDAKPWVNMLTDAEKAFERWQDISDTVDKAYGDLEQLASAGDRQFQIFWANIETRRNIVYSRPPVPVVTPRFKDRRALPRKAAEILERALISDFEQDDIDGTMQMIRDDAETCGRGVPWLSVEINPAPQVRAQHLDRRDFLHGPARKWTEVPWVAKRSYLSRKQMQARFEPVSGDLWTRAEYSERGEGADETDYRGEKKAEVWEIWHKEEGVVLWICKDIDEVLDAQPPYLDLEGFFPCPKPAYATVQRGTLIPLPDWLYYRDQIDEINKLTSRIAAIMEDLRVAGIVPGGAKDIAEAISSMKAIQTSGEDRVTLIPVPSMAALQAGSGGKLVEWWPIDAIVVALRELVQQRKVLIDDVYEITGISDIMRGNTEATETLGAQQLKSQFGSARIKNRQAEMVRVARDITRMKAEIMAEGFDAQTLLQMSQVDDVPSVEQAQRRVAQMPVEQAQQTLQNTVTIEAVMELFQTQRTRPFVLEIETDSTIQPDEDADKQRRVEFITAIGGFMQQALPIVQAAPQAAGFAGEALKFLASGFRAGRELDAKIDEFATMIEEQAGAAAQQQQGPSPEQIEAQAKAEQGQAEIQMKAQGQQFDQQIAQQRMAAEMALKREIAEAEFQLKAEIAAAELGLKAEVEGFKAKIAADAQASKDAIRRDTAGEA